MFKRRLQFAILVIWIIYLSVACHQSVSVKNNRNISQTNTPIQVASPSKVANSQPPPKIKVKDDAQLVDIQAINKNIVLDIRYATNNNFLKRKLYPIPRCVLRFATAQRLSKVQEDLAQKKLGLKVYDCYRPLSVQKQMWQVLPDSRYVANPTNGSRHNRGAAVDVTLIDGNGNELEMPSAFDDFTSAAYKDYSGGSVQARKHRQLLEDVMQKYAFVGLATEWWHFDAPGWENFPVMDMQFNEIPST